MVLKNDERLRFLTESLQAVIECAHRAHISGLSSYSVTDGKLNREILLDCYDQTQFGVSCSVDDPESAVSKNVLDRVAANLCARRKCIQPVACPRLHGNRSTVSQCQ